MTKRLFIFASYDKDGIIDPTLLHYLNALSELGDIVFTMDNDISDAELSKVTAIHNVLHATATRHGEYDFGSYKRGYIWAHDNKILEKYDWVYLVNDSVYGPLFDLKPAVEKLESNGTDLTGLVSSEINKFPPHVQSWFVGLSKKIFIADFFEEFITNVSHQAHKALIVLKYEVRMSRLIIDHGYKMSVIFSDPDAIIYRDANPVLNAGVPFVKKATMKSCEIIEFLNPYTTGKFVDDILNYAIRHNCNKSMIGKYIKIFRFALLGLPLLSVFRRDSEYKNGIIDYKVKLFDRIAIAKFSITKLKKKAE